MNSQILVIDNDAQVLKLLGKILEGEEAVVSLENDPVRGLEQLTTDSIDILFTELCMPGFDGLEVIRRAHSRKPKIPVVAMSAYGSIESCVNAFRLGAVDYLTKPFRAEHVAAALARAAAVKKKLQGRNGAWKSTPHFHAMNEVIRFVAASPAMKGVMAQAERVAAAPVPVLVLGELGVGKEMLVRAIHAISPQSRGPLVKVNCEAVNENQLIETFFGQEPTKTAEGGSTQCGAIERAADGFLLLHDVVRLPKWMQAELLHAIQTGEFRRKGGITPVPFRSRVAATSSQDLAEFARGGGLLDDLRCYLNVVPIRVPPLRERREDIRPLIRHHLHESDCVRLKLERRQEISFAEDALKILEAYDWPGNVYELSSFVRRAIVLATCPQVNAVRVSELLPPARAVRQTQGAETITVPFFGDIRLIERAIVTEAIQRARVINLQQPDHSVCSGDNSIESSKTTVTGN